MLNNICYILLFSPVDLKKLESILLEIVVFFSRGLSKWQVVAEKLKHPITISLHGTAPNVQSSGVFFVLLFFFLRQAYFNLDRFRV